MVARAFVRRGLFVVVAVLALVPSRAAAQAPPPDPFLGVPILTSGAAAPGAPVAVVNSVDRTTSGLATPALTATNLATGYDATVLDPIRNFTAAPFTFTVTGVTNADNTPGVLGSPVTARRVNLDGTPIAGAAGTFTLTPQGTFTFTRGAAFADLDTPGETARVAVDYQLHGVNGANSQQRDFGGTLYVDLKVLPDGTIQETPAANFADYGSSRFPATNQTVFPDLQSFVQGLLRFEFAGNAGSPLTVTNTANLTTSGLLAAHGISATTIGSRGSDGRDASVLDSSTDGQPGGVGGAIGVSSTGAISTAGIGAVGIFAWSAGGDGGQGGDSGYTRNSKAGGPAGTGGAVQVTGGGVITTARDDASGILALSQGGNGGGGGDGSTFNGAENGANGGRGGTVTVNGNWFITTNGNKAYGIWAKSFGGAAGSGGDGGWTGTSSGDGGEGTEGGSVSITSGGLVKTFGNDAYGLFAQSIGGFGGDGGSGTSIFYATGGSGTKAGSGGQVYVANTGSIITIGIRSHGIFAESVGGGGGTGGDGSALAGLGGSGAGGGDAGSVTVVNTGSISATGADARGIYAQSVGGGGGDGGDGAGLVGIGGKGSATSDGGTVVVSNTGSISAASNAIFAQSVGGGGGDGGSAAGLIAVGGDGGAGGNADKVTVSSHGNLSTTAGDATALFAQSVGGGGGNGGNSVAAGVGLAAAIGGRGGVGGLGSDVKVGVDVDSGDVDPVTGLILTSGANSHGIQAQSVGGGGGNGGFAYAGSVGPGISAALALGGKGGSGNAAKSVSVYFGSAQSVILTGGANANGIFAQSVGGGGGNGGLSVSAAASTGVAVGLSVGGNGGTGADAGTVTVGDDLHPLLGTIVTGGEHSYGVLAQSVGGGGGNGGMAISVAVSAKGSGSFAIGGDGGAAGAGAAVGLVSNALIATNGDNSHGLFAQSVGGGGGSGGASVAAGISGGESLELSFGGKGAGGGSASSVTLTSAGSGIDTYGQKSYGILAQSIGGGGGDGGFAVSGGISGGSNVNVGIGGSGGTASDSGIVTLTNASPIFTLGHDSHAIFAQSTGGGGGSGGFSVAGGVSKSGSFDAAVGGGGGAGGNGSNVIVANTATTLQTMGDRAYGMLAQSIGGGGGDGGFAVAGGISQSTSVALGIGGKGNTGGHAGTVGLTNSASILTSGQLAHGIFAQSVGGGGGSGGFSIAGAVSTQNAMSVSIGGAGGTASYADLVSVTNSGAITTGGDGTGQGSYGILVQSVGGGGGAGGFSGSFSGTFGGKKNGKSLSLSIGGEGGSGGDGGVVFLANSGRILTKASDSVGLFAQSVGGGGGNGGFSLTAALSTGPQSYDVGVSIGGSGGAAGNAKSVTLTNDAVVETAGDHSHGIQAQSIGGGGGNGGFSIAATGGTGKETKSAGVAVGGTGGSGGDALDVLVTNNAAILTSGSDSSGIQAQSLGGGGGNGGFAISGSLAGETGKSLSIALGADGGAGGAAGTVDVRGTGAYTIQTLGDRSVGVQAMSIGGGGGNGGFSGSVALGEGGSGPGKASTSIGISVGGDGAGGDKSGAVSIGTALAALQANIVTSGQESVGIQAQSIGGGGGNGGMSLSGSVNAVLSEKAANNNIAIAVGGTGGSGNDAAVVLVHAESDIFTSGNGAHAIQAQSIGGGGGNAGGAQALTLQLGQPTTPPANETPEQKKQRKKDAASNKSLALSIGGAGGLASDGSTVTVDHTGDITTLGGDAHGIFAQSIGGGGGSGGDADEGVPAVNGLPLIDLALHRLDRSSKGYSGKDIAIVVGGSGGASGNANAVTVTNHGSILTYGDNSHGVFAQSIGGGGGAGGSGELGIEGTIGVGGGTGSTGNGGAVLVTLGGAISTYGNGAHGIFAQSIGGGGGAAGNVDRGLKNYANVGLGVAFGQGGGNGGNGSSVIVDSTANLFTFGTGSTGIFAQSIGGGGGVAGDLGNDLPYLSVTSFAGSVGGTGSADLVKVTQVGDITTLGDASDGIFAQSAGGQQTGKAVTVALNSGSILASGAESNGIFAQSTGMGGRDNITVTIANADSVVMGGTGTGAAVRFADGAANTLVNQGTITTMSGLAGTSIVGGTGSETVQNFGTVNGSIDLGAGINVFNNQATGLFNTGAHLRLGPGSTLNNAGTLSAGGWGNVQTTTVDGNMTQLGTPKWLVDLGAGGSSDRFAMTGTAQLGASVTTLDLNALTTLTTGAYTLATAAGGLGGSTFKFGTYFGEMPVGQTLRTVSSNTDVQLTVTDSTGLFRFTGRNGGFWTSPFVSGISNWASTADGGTYVYGTPGAATDVVIGQGAGITQLGADFRINSLRFDSAALGNQGDAGIAGGSTLTLLANGGNGITLEAGRQSATIGANLVLGASQTWTNNSTGLLAVVGNSIVANGQSLTIDGAGQTQIDADLDLNRGALVKNGAGVLVLNGRNRYSGGTTVTGGTLFGSALSLQGAIVNDATVIFQQTSAGEYGGSMSGKGLLVKQGDGLLTLTGANSYSGGTFISAGSLRGTTKSLQGEILNQGTLVFDQSEDGTYAGSLFGAGALNLRGGGHFTFTGNSGAFTGNTTVSGSRLTVNGWLGGAGLLAESGSTIGGNGIIPSLRLQSGAALAPGNSIGTIVVTGSATFEAGSTYEVETEAYGSADLTMMTGRLLGAGGVVSVHAGGTKRYRPINRYTIVRADGGVATQFAGATADLSFLAPSLQYDDTRVFLTLRRNDVDFRSIGTRGNQTKVAEVFNQLVATATGAFADSINSVYDLSDADARHALGSMSGVIYQHAARSGLAAAQAFTALGMKRLDIAARDAGGSAGDAGRESLRTAGAEASFLGSDEDADRSRGFWISALGGAARYAGGAGDAGAKVRLYGLAFGVDHVVNRALTLGISGGQAQPNVNLNGADDQAVTKTTQVGAYGRLRHAASRLDAALSVGRQRDAVTRIVTDGALLGGTHAAFDGTSVSSQLEYGYGMTLGRGVTLEPQAGYQYGRLALDGATESGVDVLNLVVPERRVPSQRGVIGARVAKAFGGGVSGWTMEGRASWAHDFRAMRDVRVRFVGDSTTDGFALAAPNQMRDSAILGVGVTGRPHNGFRLSLGVDAQVSGPVSTFSGNVSVNKRW